MRATHFDRLTRMVSAASRRRGLGHDLTSIISRRQTLAALALGLFGVSSAPRHAAGGPGCKNVGRKCRRRKQCCSSVCRGKKGKKRCKAHDTGGCRAGQQSTGCGGNDVACTTNSGNPGICETTTGNAGFCAFSGDCFPCQKDADCREVCGPRAACTRCASTCFGVGGTACFGPDACDFQ
ncbi:MAG: hypothetical protein ACRDJC_11270 [Thermomicrobiales bacterium]